MKKIPKITILTEERLCAMTKEDLIETFKMIELLYNDAINCSNDCIKILKNAGKKEMELLKKIPECGFDKLLDELKNESDVELIIDILRLNKNINYIVDYHNELVDEIKKRRC